MRTLARAVYGKPPSVDVTLTSRTPRARVCAAPTVQVVDGEAREVSGKLGPGAYFGELALIKDCPRAATVTATMETSCVKILRADFKVRRRVYVEGWGGSLCVCARVCVCVRVLVGGFFGGWVC